MRVLLKLIFVIITPILLLAALIVILIFMQFTNMFEPSHRTVELVSSSTNSKLFIKTENWGVTGDRQLTIITTEGNRKFEIDSTNQIIFNGPEPFLYKQKNDTLILHVHTKAIVPKGFKSNWTIIQQDDEQKGSAHTDYEYKKI